MSESEEEVASQKSCGIQTDPVENSENQLSKLLAIFRNKFPGFRQNLVAEEPDVDFEVESAHNSDVQVEIQNIPFLDRSILFIYTNWKIILLAIVFLVLLLIIFLLVLFLVILPGSQEETVVLTTTTMLLNTTTSSFSSTSSSISTTTANIKSTQSTTTGTPKTVPRPLSCKNNMQKKRVEEDSICTKPFKKINNKCINLITTTETRTNANQKCREMSGGAALITIKTPEDAQLVANVMRDQNVQKAWIGLVCRGNTVSGCTWDHGRGPLDYSNFERGFPNLDFGYCVFTFGMGKGWVSEDCDTGHYYICEIPPTTPDYCQNNYNNNCYIRIDVGMGFDEGTEHCKEQCADLVTIHSELENEYVQSLFNIPGYLMLGGVAPSKDLIIWNDKEPTGYSNMVSYDEQSVFIHMDYVDGNWYTSVGESWIVCKRPAGVE